MYAGVSLELYENQDGTPPTLGEESTPTSSCRVPKSPGSATLALSSYSQDTNEEKTRVMSLGCSRLWQGLLSKAIAPNRPFLRIPLIGKPEWTFTNIYRVIVDSDPFHTDSYWTIVVCIPIILDGHISVVITGILLVFLDCSLSWWMADNDDYGSVDTSEGQLFLGGEFQGYWDMAGSQTVLFCCERCVLWGVENKFLIIYLFFWWMIVGKWSFMDDLWSCVMSFVPDLCSGL